MKIAIGSDHAGYPLKKPILEYLKKKGHKVEDYGSHNPDPVDFPIITKQVCNSVVNGENDRGIMICGTGVGASIAANKMVGIRASVIHDMYSAKQCVEHDNVNVAAIGAQIVGDRLAFNLIDTFLSAKFNTSEQFVRRVNMLEDMNN